MAKRIVSLCLALLLALSCAALGETMRVVNCAEWVSLRCDPSTYAPVIAQVPLGALVEAEEYDGEFMYCTYQGMGGFIRSGYLAYEPTNDRARASQDWGKTMWVVNCAESVTLRSYASTGAPGLLSVPLGAEVVAYEHVADFINCTYGGRNGYILASYLSYDEPTYDYEHAGSTQGRELKVINCKDWVTLRSYDSTFAPSVARVPLGATVIAYERSGDFTNCSYKGINGYILSQYLGESSTRRIVNCKDSVTLRSYASTSAPALASVPLGATVVFIGYAANGFAQCSYNGKQGYILEKYLG